MSTQVIQIKKNPTPTSGQPAVFSPQNAVANAGDTLSFNNADTEPHWPAPSVANPTGYFPYQIIAGGQSGDLGPPPNPITVTVSAVSPVVVFTTAAAPATGVIVQITGGTGAWTAINGRFSATNLSATTFSVPVGGMVLPVAGKLSAFAGYTMNYVCVLHPAETGSITANPQP